MAKSSEYWAERFNLLQESQLNKADQTVADLERVYNRAIASVERDMRDWYARFAVNNEIDLTEAKKLLKSADLSEFKWTLDEYNRAAKASAFDTKYIKQLENASAKVHISRLEALEIQLRQKVEALHTMREDTLETLSRDIFEERYYKSAYETQLGLNIGWDVAKLNDKLIDTVINKPWAPDGINFSKRIWRDRDRLVEKLHTEMTQMIIRGEAPDRVINEISKSFNTSKNVAGRLVMTESAFFASAGQEKAFDDLGVEEFEIVATLDRKTSDLCQSLDGKVVPMKDYAPGVTAPPFHSWCRTTTVPYFEDLGGERIARGVDGETYFVPSDMNYPQWKKVFVDKEITMDQWQSKTDPLAAKFKDVYDKWDKSNVKTFATGLLKSENINLPVNRRKISANGQCQLYHNRSDVIEVLTYELNSADTRDIDYQVKTTFHELFHAKADGLKHGGIGQTRSYSFKDWAYYDDVFAESFAHHMSKSVGIQREIMPAYPGHLIETLPKLKTLDDFKNCNTIADFGAVAQKYRFSKDATTDWSDLKQLMGGVKFDKIEYSKQYLDYIEDNVEDLVDKALENMPQYKSYRSNMISDVKSGVLSVRNGQRLSGNSEMMFDQALLLTMNRLGVK
jgi:SPP1 gp7 family putative phage head morphogenesis protein